MESMADALTSKSLLASCAKDSGGASWRASDQARFAITPQASAKVFSADDPRATALTTTPLRNARTVSRKCGSSVAHLHMRTAYVTASAGDFVPWTSDVYQVQHGRVMW
jgi:hypothetical protein